MSRRDSPLSWVVLWVVLAVLLILLAALSPLGRMTALEDKVSAICEAVGCEDER